MGEVGELYTIDQGNEYEPDKMIDTYASLLWTERFIKNGDFQVDIAATKGTVKLLRPGTMLGLSTSRELMMIHSRSIKDGVLTVKGATIEAFFDERRHSPLQEIEHPGVFMGHVVENMQTRRGGAHALPGLRIGDLATLVGGAEFFNIKAGDVHKTILEIGTKYTIGQAVYWVEKPEGGHELVYSTRYGEDLAFDDDDRIVFSPELDTLTDIEELLSDEGSKNVAIAYPPTNLSIVPPDYPTYTATLDDVDLVDIPKFQRRLVEVSMDFITKADQLEGANTTEKLASLWTMMRQRAEAALKPQKKIIDGEMTSGARYRYYTERNPDKFPTFRLGDRAVISGNFTDPMIGIMSEYIQSSDPNGSRSYPTIETLGEFIQSGGGPAS